MSRTRSNRRARRKERSVDRIGSLGTSRTPSAAATATGTRAASVSGASSTSHTPSGYSGTRSAASRRARRVLPQPPVPVNVSKRGPEGTPTSRWRNSAISRSRPTKLVDSMGKFVRMVAWTAAGARSSGSAVGRLPRRAAFSSSARSADFKSNAEARSCTVSRQGRWRVPRSRSLMARVLT